MVADAAIFVAAGSAALFVFLAVCGTRKLRTFLACFIFHVSLPEASVFVHVFLLGW